MEITYFGHSCFEVKISGKKILFDPFLSYQPNLKKEIIESIIPDYIFISHGHGDHIGDAVTLTKNYKCEIITNFEISNWLIKQGIGNVHSMSVGGSINLKFGKAHLLNAIHSSSLPDGSYGGCPVGFLIESNEGNFYFAGDTSLTIDFKIIAELFKLDFVFLPIGGNYTMDYKTAIIAANYMNCSKIIGMHYNTFDVIKIDTNAAINEFNKNNKELILLNIGQTINI